MVNVGLALLVNAAIIVVNCTADYQVPISNNLRNKEITFARIRRL